MGEAEPAPESRGVIVDSLKLRSDDELFEVWNRFIEWARQARKGALEALDAVTEEVHRRLHAKKQ